MSRGGGGDILLRFGVIVGGALVGVASFCFWGLLADVANLPATPPADLPVSDPYLLRALTEDFSTDVSAETLRQEEVPFKKAITVGLVTVAVLPLLKLSVGGITMCNMASSIAASRSMQVLQHLPEGLRPKVFIKPFPHRWQKVFIYVAGLFFARECLIGAILPLPPIISTSFLRASVPPTFISTGLVRASPASTYHCCFSGWSFIR